LWVIRTISPVRSGEAQRKRFGRENRRRINEVRKRETKGGEKMGGRREY